MSSDKAYEMKYKALKYKAKLRMEGVEFDQDGGLFGKKGSPKVSLPKVSLPKVDTKQITAAMSSAAKGTVALASAASAATVAAAASAKKKYEDDFKNINAFMKVYDDIGMKVKLSNFKEIEKIYTNLDKLKKEVAKFFTSPDSASREDSIKSSCLVTDCVTTEAKRQIKVVETNLKKDMATIVTEFENAIKELAKLTLTSGDITYLKARMYSETVAYVEKQKANKAIVEFQLV